MIPGVGTLVGGLVSAAINSTFTSIMGDRIMKLFETKILQDDNGKDDEGFTFLKNRIESYRNIFDQLEMYMKKNNWEFDSWLP